jgi:LmeA-like phospholipid-binding
LVVFTLDLLNLLFMTMHQAKWFNRLLMLIIFQTMTAVTRTLLTPILQLWLRSQLESAQELKVKISGSDRQLWQGIIPLTEVSGTGIVYQGLHLSQIGLSATEIQLNVGQVLKGDSLKLLAAIAVKLDLRLKVEDFRLCLAAPLIRNELDQTLANNASDLEIENFVKLHLQKLGDQFRLKELQVQNGACYCEGEFWIAAT